MNMATIRKTPAIIERMINRGAINLNHFSNGTIAIPKIAIKTPFVGMIMFENPFPEIDAKTAVLLSEGYELLIRQIDAEIISGFFKC